jgi:hypothetical protein
MKLKELLKEMTVSTDVGSNPLHYKNTKYLFSGKLIRRRLGNEFESFIKIINKRG